MEQSLSWEANTSSASQEIPCILWNPKDHYGFYKSPPLVPILKKIQPMPPIHLPKDLSYYFPSMPGSSKLSLSFRFSHEHPVYSCSRQPISFFSIGSPEK